jgi:hypothetical protein
MHNRELATPTVILSLSQVQVVDPGFEVLNTTQDVHESAVSAENVFAGHVLQLAEPAAAAVPPEHGVQNILFPDPDCAYPPTHPAPLTTSPHIINTYNSR